MFKEIIVLNKLLNCIKFICMISNRNQKVYLSYIIVKNKALRDNMVSSIAIPEKLIKTKTHVRDNELSNARNLVGMHNFYWLNCNQI